MDFNTTIDIIIKDLNEAREIIDDLKKYPGVPPLQIEIVKSKCKSACEVIALLKNMQIDQKLAEVNKPEEKKEEEKPEEIEGKDLVTPNQEEEKKTQVRSEKSRYVASEKKGESKKSKGKAPETSIIADKFSHMSSRFNEQLSNLKHDDDISDILRTKPISNLSEAIGVNDRFIFIREIFNGNKDSYNQAISRLDKAENLADARAVIMSFTGDTIDNEAVKQLLDLVKRKLPSNE
jgi:hypothetical protein